MSETATRCVRVRLTDTSRDEENSQRRLDVSDGRLRSELCMPHSTDVCAKLVAAARVTELVDRTG
eukprot:650809-Rhodomonas_salina.1